MAVCGILLVVVHSGETLMAMDDDGYSDPYCIVAANKEKVTTLTTWQSDSLWDISHLIFYCIRGEIIDIN